MQEWYSSSDPASPHTYVLDKLGKTFRRRSEIISGMNTPIPQSFHIRPIGVWYRVLFILIIIGMVLANDLDVLIQIAVIAICVWAVLSTLVKIQIKDGYVMTGPLWPFLLWISRQSMQIQDIVRISSQAVRLRGGSARNILSTSVLSITGKDESVLQIFPRGYRLSDIQLFFRTITSLNSAISLDDTVTSLVDTGQDSFETQRATEDDRIATHALRLFCIIGTIVVCIWIGWRIFA